MRAILTYHSIDRSGSAISVTPETFRAHVEWLAGSAVKVVPLNDLFALGDDVNAVALTFDDALASVATEAAPVLAAHGFPATVFVVTRHVGTDNRWNGAGDFSIPIQAVLGWDALLRLRAQGFEIGGHTRHHRHLLHCNRTELHEELAGCADDIAAALGERPTTFAYPYGEADARVAGAAAQHFPICCTTEFKPLKAGVRRELVPRLDAWYFADTRQLARWGTGGFRRRLALRNTLRRVRRSFR